MSRWQRLKAWWLDQWWNGLLVGTLVASFNIGLAWNADSTPALWVNLLGAGWITGWGMYSVLYHYRLKRDAITRQQIMDEAEADICQQAGAWARESIRRVMTDARQQGLLPPNVNFYFADEMPPSETKH
jgi:hypothetical protein